MGGITTSLISCVFDLSTQMELVAANTMLKAALPAYRFTI